MIGAATYKIKPLSTESSYYTHYQSSLCKGDKAVEVFGKSELDDIKDVWWDSVKKEILPWRGGTVVTDRGTFHWCVYFNWWGNRQQEPNKLFNRLFEGNTIEEDDKTTIYFWKEVTVSESNHEEVEKPKRRSLRLKKK